MRPGTGCVNVAFNLILVDSQSLLSCRRLSLGMVVRACENANRPVQILAVSLERQEMSTNMLLRKKAKGNWKAYVDRHRRSQGVTGCTRAEKRSTNFSEKKSAPPADKILVTRMLDRYSLYCCCSCCSYL